MKYTYDYATLCKMVTWSKAILYPSKKLFKILSNLGHLWFWANTSTKFYRLYSNMVITGGYTVSHGLWFIHVIETSDSMFM